MHFITNKNFIEHCNFNCDVGNAEIIFGIVTASNHFLKAIEKRNMNFVRARNMSKLLLGYRQTNKDDKLQRTANN